MAFTPKAELPAWSAWLNAPKAEPFVAKEKLFRPKAELLSANATLPVP
jgi:hypothetical protein